MERSQTQPCPLPRLYRCRESAKQKALCVACRFCWPATCSRGRYDAWTPIDNGRQHLNWIGNNHEKFLDSKCTLSHPGTYGLK
jgi:hypothetical protein